MPLFGKKKSAKNQPQGSYPVASHPTAPPPEAIANQVTGSDVPPPPSYDSQTGPPSPQPYHMYAQGSSYPRPFLPTASGYPGQQPSPVGYSGQQPPPVGYPGQQLPPAGYPGQQLPPAGYPGQQVPPAGYPDHQPTPPQYQSLPNSYPPQPMQSPTVVVQGGFDAGARFDVAGPTIPPPPPGCPANASQVAAAQGYNVVVTQQPNDFIAGGSDGGMTIW